MGSKQTQITTSDGEQATVRNLENTESGRRHKVTHPDGRAWIVTVALPGGEVNVEVSRQDGEPADLATPRWLTDQLSRLAAPA